MENKEMQDSLYDYLKVLDGRRYSLKLNNDQLVRAMFVKVSKEPCLFCAGDRGEPFQVGIMKMPAGLQKEAFSAFYSVCQACFVEGNVQDRAMKLILANEKE